MKCSDVIEVPEEHDSPETENGMKLLIIACEGN